MPQQERRQSAEMKAKVGETGELRASDSATSLGSSQPTSKGRWSMSSRQGSQEHLSNGYSSRRNSAVSGASRSSRATAQLLSSAGAPDQESAGGDIDGGESEASSLPALQELPPLLDRGQHYPLPKDFVKNTFRHSGQIKLHTQLSKAAAVLRMTKESQSEGTGSTGGSVWGGSRSQTGKTGSSQGQVPIEEMREECMNWHAESDRLQCQVDELNLKLRQAERGLERQRAY